MNCSSFRILESFLVNSNVITCLSNSIPFDCTCTILSIFAVIAGSYSRAWKRGTGAIDVYHVLGAQVSFSAPSGEYVPRGGAIVRGKRINHSGVPLELGIGIEFFESWAQIIAGPVNPIQKRCKSYVKIFPGDIPKSKIAKEVRERFMKEADEVQRRLIRALDLNEFVSFIPGDSRFSRE